METLDLYNEYHKKAELEGGFQIVRTKLKQLLSAAGEFHSFEATYCNNLKNIETTCKSTNSIVGKKRYLRSALKAAKRQRLLTDLNELIIVYNKLVDEKKKERK